MDYEGSINKISFYKIGEKVRITDNYYALYKQLKIGVNEYDAKRDTKNLLNQVGIVIGIHKFNDVDEPCYTIEVNNLIYPLQQSLLNKF